MIDKKLDDLLQAPLAPVSDDDFSTAVMARVAGAPRGYHPLAWLEIAVLAFSGLLALAVVPVHVIADVAMRASAEIANSTATAMACLAIVVTVALVRSFETD